MGKFLVLLAGAAIPLGVLFAVSGADARFGNPVRFVRDVAEGLLPEGPGPSRAEVSPSVLIRGWPSAFRKES